MSKIIGIDLGTTNSCAAVMEMGKPVVIVNKEGNRTTSSVVAITTNGERLVGDTAKRQAVSNAKGTISSIKRKMGTNEKVILGSDAFTPQEISAMILSEIKKSAEEFIGEPVTEAVITVPAYFNDAQRQATKEAGRIAGLEVKRIINEPTAAALAYGLTNDDHQKIMVYDLGGGTFDVSIIEFGDSIVEVLATAGNNHLGGDDFDKKIVEYLVQAFKKAEGVDLPLDTMTTQRLYEAAEKAKKELSSSQSTAINIPFITVIENEPRHINTTMTRAEFENLISPLIESTKEQISRTMQDAKLNYGNIDKIILVGGSTRIPLVEKLIKEWTGITPAKNINPDESVAMGAAIQGANLQGNTSTALLLLDVTSLSLSVEVSTGEASVMVKRNTTIPYAHTEIFSTADDFQTSVCINICQGERLMAKDNKKIGSVVLSDIQPAPKGVPQIEVTFEINEDGIVNVSAMDKKTQKSVKAVIRSQNLSQSEIEDAIRKAEMFEEQDRKLKEKIDATNNAHSMIHKARNLINVLVEDNDKKILEEQISALENELQRDVIEPQIINEMTDELLKIMNTAYSAGTTAEPIVDAEGFRKNSQESQDFYNNF